MMVETLDTASMGRKRLSGKRLKYLIGGLVIVAGVGYLIFSAA